MNTASTNPVCKSTPEQIIDQIQYHGSLRAYDLHKFLGISRVAVHKHLRKLLANGELKKIGKPPLVEYVLSDTSNSKGLTLDKIKDRILPILKEAHVKKAALFGSYVRGDNTKKSDVDILVTFPEDATLIDVVHLQHQMEQQLQKKVDIVSNNAISPLIKDSILKYQYPLL